MPHQQMFDDDDPILARVRDIAFAFPDTAEKVSNGRPVFFTKKVFAVYGGSIKADGTWIQHPQSVLILPDPNEREALLADPRCYQPGYWGPWGWLGWLLDAGSDWQEVSELLEDSYLLTAAPASIARLNADRDGGGPPAPHRRQ
ncbi:MAG: MmcQ/YjbR family DNA-binding protein [Beutenbergiaceae bacterium]